MPARSCNKTHSVNLEMLKEAFLNRSCLEIEEWEFKDIRTLLTLEYFILYGLVLHCHINFPIKVRQTRFCRKWIKKGSTKKKTDLE